MHFQSRLNEACQQKEQTALTTCNTASTFLLCMVGREHVNVLLFGLALLALHPILYANPRARASHHHGMAQKWALHNPMCQMMNRMDVLLVRLKRHAPAPLPLHKAA